MKTVLLIMKWSSIILENRKIIHGQIKIIFTGLGAGNDRHQGIFTIASYILYE